MARRKPVVLLTCKHWLAATTSRLETTYLTLAPKQAKQASKQLARSGGTPVTFPFPLSHQQHIRTYDTIRMRKCNAGDKKGSGRITGESFLAPNQWRGWKAVVGGLRSGLGGLRVSVRTCFSQYLPVQCSCSGGGGTATSRRSPSPTFFLTTN